MATKNEPARQRNLFISSFNEQRSKLYQESSRTEAIRSAKLIMVLEMREGYRTTHRKVVSEVYRVAPK